MFYELLISVIWFSVSPSPSSPTWPTRTNQQQHNRWTQTRWCLFSLSYDSDALKTKPFQAPASICDRHGHKTKPRTCVVRQRKAQSGSHWFRVRGGLSERRFVVVPRTQTQMLSGFDSRLLFHCSQWERAHTHIYTQTHTCTHTMDWTDRIRDSRYILSVSFFSSLTPSLSWACKALIIHKVSSWLHIAVADTGSLSLHLFFLFFFCSLGRANRLGSHTDSNLQAHKRHSSMLRIIVFPFIISLF